MGFSIGWLLEFIDAFTNGDALPRKEPEEYDCAETTWGVFKANAFFGNNIFVRKLRAFSFFCTDRKPLPVRLSSH